MVDADAGGQHVDADDVDAHRGGGHLALAEPQAGQAAQTQVLLVRHRLDRGPEALRTSRLHLDDDDLAPVTRDDVDLTLAASPVRLEDLVAERGEVGTGMTLALRTERAPRVRR